MKKILLLFFIVITLAFLYGCGDKTSSKQSDGAVSKESATNMPAYPASLSDGIDFTKPGYPTFIVETQGISGFFEPWGRWTDGDKAIIKFQDALPQEFNLELVVNSAFGPNANAPIIIRVGANEQTFTVTQPNETFRFACNKVQNVNTIEIIPPKPTSPKSMNLNNDERRLGIRLVALRIIKRESR
jgi:phosphoglycerol transferase